MQSIAPVYCVDWTDAAYFANVLSVRTTEQCYDLKMKHCCMRKEQNVWDIIPTEAGGNYARSGLSKG